LQLTIVPLVEGFIAVCWKIVVPGGCTSYLSRAHRTLEYGCEQHISRDARKQVASFESLRFTIGCEIYIYPASEAVFKIPL
jgi:hypothetical protein